MKGIIFTTFEQFVRERLGEEFLDELLERSELKTTEAFVAPGTYPDEDLVTLVVNAAELAGLEVPEALHAFGSFAFPKLALCLGDLKSRYRDPEDLLAHVDDIIHVEVRKLWPEATTPRILIRPSLEGELEVRYDSTRSLCAVFEGLVEGLAGFYETTVECEHLHCTHDGAKYCDFAIRFAR